MYAASMTNMLHFRPAAAAITGGLLILGGAAVAPALAYPAGASLSIACDAISYAPGATATCTLSNTDPAGPDDIALGGQIASGDDVRFALASLAAQDASTYTEQLVLPTTIGTYEVIGTSAGETARTTVQVVADGTATTGAATTPRTGANIALGLAVGLGALGIGGGIYAVSRRTSA